MMEKFTVEEINLMCIFNTSTRALLLDDLIMAINDFDDEELFQITLTALNKVSKMSDTEFAELEFYPEYGEDEVIN